MEKDNWVEVLELWRPAKNNEIGEANRFYDGETVPMKRIALWANGRALMLEEGLVSELRHITPPEHEELKKKFG